MSKIANNKGGMIYVHVPFCASRCIYCDFYSTTLPAPIREAYVEAACRELRERTSYLPSPNIRTIYFGGGTPSQLTTEEIGALLTCIRSTYNVQPQAEMTLECNPDDITPHFVQSIKKMGINRVSLGVQSFDDNILQLLNRRHSSQEAQDAVTTLFGNGLDNISIDLIYGLPRQDIQSFQRDLQTAFALPIRHLSSYALSVEEGTTLARRIAEKQLTIASEETFAAEYQLLMQEAKAHGFDHYEISNFALPGYASRHNSGYWDGTPYLGIGPGAHSFDGIDRCFNLPDVRAYIEQSARGQFPHETEHLHGFERYNELIFTSLRTSRGLALSVVGQRFGEEMLEYLKKNARPHLDAGRLIMKEDQLTVAPNFILVSDDIISDLMIEGE